MLLLCPASTPLLLLLRLALFSYLFPPFSSKPFSSGHCSSDLEFEMERFSEALAEQTAKYTYMERPRGSLAQQVCGTQAGMVLLLEKLQPITD